MASVHHASPLTRRTAAHAWLLAPLLVGCGMDVRRSSAREGDSVTEAGSPAPRVLELRVPAGVERGALLDSARVLVQAGQSHLFVYHRVDGRRVPLVDDARRGGRAPQLLWSQALPDGTVAAYDARTRQVAIYDSAGAVVRTVSLEAPTGFPVPVAAFADGRMVVLRDHLPSPYAQETGLYADTSVLMPVAPSLEPTGADIPLVRARRFGGLHALDASDAASRAKQVRAVGGGVFDGRARRSIEVPLSPRTMVATARDGFYVGMSDSADVRFLDPTGRERGRIRIAEQPQRVDAATAVRLREAAVESGDDAFAALYREVDLPRTSPRYRQLLADHDGRLWVEPFSLEADGSQHWTVYRRDGTRVGSTTLPPGSRLLDASRDEMLVASRGRFRADILQVVPYRLR